MAARHASRHARRCGPYGPGHCGTISSGLRVVKIAVAWYCIVDGVLMAAWWGNDAWWENDLRRGAWNLGDRTHGELATTATPNHHTVTGIPTRHSVRSSKAELRSGPISRVRLVRGAKPSAKASRTARHPARARRAVVTGRLEAASTRADVRRLSSHRSRVDGAGVHGHPDDGAASGTVSSSAPSIATAAGPSAMT